MRKENFSLDYLREDKVERRIKGWKDSPMLKVHITLDKIIKSGNSIEKNNLITFLKVEYNFKNPYAIIQSLKTDAGHSFGKALIEREGIIKLNPEKEKLILNAWKN